MKMFVVIEKIEGMDEDIEWDEIEGETIKILGVFKNRKLANTFVSNHPRMSNLEIIPTGFFESKKDIKNVLVSILDEEIKSYIKLIKAHGKYLDELVKDLRKQERRVNKLKNKLEAQGIDTSRLFPKIPEASKDLWREYFTEEMNRRKLVGEVLSFKKSIKTLETELDTLKSKRQKFKLLSV